MRFALVPIVLLGLSEICGCRPSQPKLEVGALYSVDDGEGHYRIAKILALDDRGVHMRLYKKKFSTRPATADPSSLTLGSVDDADGFGMGHLPLTRRAFLAWEPVFIAPGVVSAEELDGYEIWKEGGGYFGDE
ncbi:MAG: hypothetical protein KIT14_10925 [bacterium]|nr:hypothetical protein [bacterium]